jgi:eukaryotic-like serine/threonine-protein kinase
MQRLHMDQAHWAQLNSLLDAALDLPARERMAWLDALDPNLAPLKPQLRQLLSRAAHEETGDFLSTLPKLDGGEAHSSVRPELAGQAVGPYRLLREIGSGGMGSVWLAQRSDGLINRPIALKLPHGVWPRAGLAERMTREREILAVLNHPNIARLYDAGVAADGQPYLALEYVEGVPINEFCLERRLDVRQRLRKFLQVANAVAHAHAKLIVHRDLKPANILVTAEGQARLLDFGVAKLIAEGGAHDSALTELSGRALTLDYASPEQIAGEPITTASDVYSLGVVLYELLTEARPYAPKNRTRRALEDAILTCEPLRPSDAVRDRSLLRALRGDLDVIVMKALKKNPDERFATVNSFAEDVVRYLSGRPVYAQRDSAWYRFRKFTARNRVASAAGAALLTAIVGLAVLAVDVVQGALADQKRINVINGVFASIFHEIDPARGGGLSLATLENILLDAARQANVALPADDPMRLRIETRLARVQHQLGRTGQARTRLQRVLDTLERTQRRRTEEYLGPLLVSASFAVDERRWREAQVAASEALQLAKEVVGPRHPLTAQASYRLGLVYEALGDYPSALRHASEAQALLLSLHKNAPDHWAVVDARALHDRVARAAQAR